MKNKTLLVAFVFFTFHVTARAGDWPTYMRDNARVGWSPEGLEFPLTESWRIVSVEAPEMANTGPEERTMERKLLRHRITFDDAFHVAIVGQRLFYGSSVDDQVRCIDLASGEEVWTFFTGGPVRLAPTVFDGKVYIGSDDGFVYCLSAVDGKVIWKLRAGPDSEMILGRGEMISRWPVRTGVLIEKGEGGQDVAYFGAGIFPHELVYLYAVDAATGDIVWVVDQISESSAGRNDLSPQGYFLADEERLYIPSGRSLPAVFERATGTPKYKAKASWRSSAGGVVGGTQALLADDQMYLWGAHHVLAMKRETGNVGFGYFAGHQMAVAGEAAYLANGSEIVKIDRAEYAAWSVAKHKLDMEIYGLNRSLRGAKNGDAIRVKIKGVEKKLEALGEEGIVWRTASTSESRLVVAGDALIAGGEGGVSAISIETGEEVWSAAVDGEARGLAVANGKLIVSTTTGDVHCFGSGAGGDVVLRGPGSMKASDPYPVDDLTPRYRQAAKEILETTGVQRGFALVVGSERGRLAYELAKRSEIEIYCIEPDREKVEESRALLSKARMYGTRVTVHHADLGAIPYSNYFANLIVSDDVVAGGDLGRAGEPSEIVRHLKPVGGVICLGRPASVRGSDLLSSSAMESWMTRAGLGERGVIVRGDAWVKMTRGTLPGAGNWSHQYGDAGNTAASDDERVKGGLGVLWYGDPGEGQMVNRHDGAVGPLAVNGKLFVQGEDNILAYDAYNGMFLWEKKNPDALRTGVFRNENPGNLAASDFRLYFMEQEYCHEIDSELGDVVASHALPEKLSGGGSHEWGYVAFHKGKLFGTATVRSELEEKLRRRGKVTEDMTDGIFGIDAETGEHAWEYRGGTIAHHTIAIGEDSIYFIDSSISSEERASLLQQDKSKLESLSPAEAKKEEARLKAQDVRLAVAIDAETGEVKWSKPVEVTDCSDIGIGGGKLTLIYKDGVLLLCGANANGHYWKQFMAGEFSKRRLLALSAKDGQELWVKDANYRHRPIIVKDEVIAEPWAFNLHTGAQKMREHAITGEPEPWSIMRDGHHCGMMVGSPNMLLFRSGYTGYYDMEKDIGVDHFAGHRTGCWINAIPANGLVSIPEASAGCVCLFSINSTIVMEPREKRENWSIFSSTGAKLPVKHMALNLGAPGDRRANDGTPWLAYPRPKPEKVTSLDLVLKFEDEFYPGGGFTAVNSYSFEAGGEGPSWMHASWAKGLKKMTIPLLGKGDEPARYTVRMHVQSAEKTKEPWQNVDLKIQGRNIAGDTAIKGVREFKGIIVKDDLVLEMAPSPGNPSATGPPVVTGIEVMREG